MQKFLEGWVGRPSKQPVDFFFFFFASYSDDNERSLSFPSESPALFCIECEVNYRLCLKVSLLTRERKCHEPVDLKL